MEQLVTGAVSDRMQLCKGSLKKCLSDISLSWKARKCLSAFCADYAFF